MKPEFDWVTHIGAVLDSTNYLALATSNREHVWANPVFFGYDRDLNFYFASMASTRHMEFINLSSEVAAAVYQSEQEKGQIRGIQFWGTASLVSETELPNAVTSYLFRLSDKAATPAQVADFVGDSAEFKLVKIVPSEIGYFDQRFFGEERQTVPQGITL